MDAVQEKLQFALQAHQRGDLAGAASLYRELLAQDPNHPEVMHLLGVIAFQQDDYSKAVELIGQAIAQDPSRAVYHANRGAALEHLRRFEDALAHYDAALELTPDYVEAHYNRGNVLLALSRAEEAVVSYGTAVRLQPNYVNALNNRGNAYLGLKRFEEALASYDAALRLKPDYIHGLSNRGNALLGLKRFSEALANYDTAIQFKPDYAEAWNNRGTTLSKLGRLEEALASHESACRFDPGHVEAFLNRGNVLLEIKRPEDALTCFEDALRLKPDYVEALLNRGTALLALQRVEDALQSYQAAIRLRPAYADAHYNLGTAYSESSRYEEALACYEEALRLRPEYIGAFLNRGNTLLAMERTMEAIASYDEVLEREPNHFLATLNRGHALLGLRKTGEALAAYDEALRLKPASADAFIHRGKALQELKRLDEALSAFEAGLRLKPESAEALLSRGNLLARLNRGDEARASHEEALRLDPENPLIWLFRCIDQLPVVAKTDTESRESVAAFSAALGDFSQWIAADQARRARLTDHVGKVQPFYLAYRNGNHREALSRYGDLLTEAARPSRVQTPSAGRSSSKIKLLIIGGQFRRHSVWDIVTKGIVRNLDRAVFELHLFHVGVIEDKETQWARTAVDGWRDTHECSGRRGWLAAIDQLQPDIIFYPEIGMDPVIAFLAAHRLAPLQVVGWGHPITSGLETIDCFVSGELIEASDGDSHYRESLIRLPGTGCCTERIALDVDPESVKQEWFEGTRSPRFVLPHKPFKFAPRDDDILAEIAEKTGDATFFLFEFPGETAQLRTVLDRLGSAFRARGLNAKRHLRVIPALERGTFLAFLDACDVYLDLPNFSGYTTAWQAAHRGLPIVTLEGDFMRQRLAAGLLRQIGLTDTVAQSREQYVAIAVRLAQELQDPSRAAARRRALATAASAADHRIEVVRAFETNLLRELKRRGPA